MCFSYAPDGVLDKGARLVAVTNDQTHALEDEHFTDLLKKCAFNPPSQHNVPLFVVSISKIFLFDNHIMHYS